MKERPILFSAPMVRAILEGRKTQTRRIVKTGDDTMFGAPSRIPCMTSDGGFGFSSEDEFYKCPYGQPGDRLWVREKFLPCNGIGDVHPVEIGSASYVCFRDGSQNFKVGGYFEDNKDPQACKWPRNAKWRPSIHMPRWASRINLEVTGVRVERLQDITDDEAFREGVVNTRQRESTWYDGKAIELFRDLWEKINGRDSWDANPWVWVVEFKMNSP